MNAMAKTPFTLRTDLALGINLNQLRWHRSDEPRGDGDDAPSAQH
ncbi:MAG: hypothetical protein ACR2P7_00620 [bacterium]